MNPYVYLFVRDDLSHPQQIVQTAHAAETMSQKHGIKGINHMVLCSAKDQDNLFDVSMWLAKHNIDHHVFYEPDVDEYTAIATHPLVGDERKPMKRFKLKQ